MTTEQLWQKNLLLFSSRVCQKKGVYEKYVKGVNYSELVRFIDSSRSKTGSSGVQCVCNCQFELIAKKKKKGAHSHIKQHFFSFDCAGADAGNVCYELFYM